MKQESLTEKLAKHLMRSIDDATRQRARLHLLDWLGCVAGARQSKVGCLVRPYSADNIFGASVMLGNVLEMDDIHRSSILHPGPVIWPTLISNSKVNMNRILDAAVKGYEATIAIGATFDAKHYSMYHNTSTAGQFGAAVATASLNDSDENQLVSAMGLAGSVSGGLWQMRNEPCEAKQWHIDSACRNGKAAGYHAFRGLSGPRFILEGPQGLYAATCDQPKPMEFPDQWRIQDVSFKPWGACRHAHPAIDAALELKKKHGFLDDRILVETYADAMVFCDRPNPETVVDAKFSLQHAVAIVAEKGVPELADFEPEAIASFSESRSRVIVKEMSDITKRYPEHYGARVTCGEKSVELVDTLGDLERPMSKEQIIEKARELITWGGLPEKEADRAVHLALEDDDVSSIHQMLTDWLS
ncbi:MAG: MmgE/PrpD family protein [Parasphingorhabdus sp.]